jgi:nicotinate-nucleotide--dimethylbenzimidazole phosphoribosyltransferase
VEHVVFFPAPDGAPVFRRVATLEEAVRLVEHLRNAEGVAEVSVHPLGAEVPLAFRAYYRVEVPPPAEPAAPVPSVEPAPDPVAQVPVPVPPVEALVPEQPAGLETTAVQPVAVQPPVEQAAVQPVAVQPTVEHPVIAPAFESALGFEEAFSLEQALATEPALEPVPDLFAVPEPVAEPVPALADEATSPRERDRGGLKSLGFFT